MTAAVETLVYVKDRGTPWHGLGESVEELMVAAEAMSKGGIDWAVAKEPLAPVGRSTFADKFATVRQSDGKPLGVVGTRYQIIQNADAFAFADNIVDDGQAKYETAGALWGGRRVFLSMELNHLDIDVPGDDSATKMYLVLTNSHDGSTAAEACITPIRVVCQNTLTMALGAAKRSFKIRHTGDISGKLLAAREALGVSFRYAEEFGKLAERMALKKVTDEQVLDILRTAVWPIDDEVASDERLADHPSSLAMENYQQSDNLASIRGTAWGAYNAVAEYIDFGTTYRGKANAAAEVRANSILWGTAEGKKAKAQKALMAL